MTKGSATANNAEVARLQAPSAAAIATAVNFGNLTPALTLLRPHGTSAQAYQQLTLEAIASDYEDGDKGASIVWSSNVRGLLVSPSNGSFYAQLIRYTRDPWNGAQTGAYFGDISIAVAFLLPATRAGASGRRRQGPRSRCPSPTPGPAVCR